MSGCTGLCCAAFRIPHTISELRARVREGAIVDHSGDSVEGDKLVEMLIPLTPKEARERNHQFGGDHSFPWSDRGHHFTCRHWDEETRLCRAYDERPDMCRRYPYGRGCDHGCSCRGLPVKESSS